jgi:hypothetical protein
MPIYYNPDFDSTTTSTTTTTATTCAPSSGMSPRRPRQGYRRARRKDRRPLTRALMPNNNPMVISTFFLVLASVLLVSRVESFGVTTREKSRVHGFLIEGATRQNWQLRLLEADGDDEVSDFGEEDLQVAGVVMGDLSWRVEKMRLEEANKRRFLKAKPVFLSYEDCCKWVQAWGNRWETANEW